MTSVRLHRRAVLAGALPLVLTAGVPGASAAADPFHGEALYRDVVRYAEFGEHRTAGEPDHRTSEWLADALRRAGLKAELQPWTHQQFHIRAQGLSVSGRSYDTFPLWWPAPTGPSPVVAPLAAVKDGGSLAGRIGLAILPRVPGTSSRPGGEPGWLVTRAAARDAMGLVIVTQDPAGEVVALNAMAGLGRWPIPVLCVGQRDEARLVAAAQAGETAELLLDGRYDYAAKAFEVVGRLERGPKTVVVSTPSSGWFACAGERGVGVAIWLALARWAAARRGGPSYTFVASSGHEMEAMGMRHFMGSGAPPPQTVATWLHLGAGIATYAYDFGSDPPRRLATASRARRLMTNEPGNMEVLQRHFASLPGLAPRLGDDPGGEMLMMARQGYRVWGFAGGSAFHHMRSDVPERITGPELIEPVARATAAALTELVGG